MSTGSAGGNQSQLSILVNQPVSSHGCQPHTSRSEGVPQGEGPSPQVKLVHGKGTELKICEDFINDGKCTHRFGDEHEEGVSGFKINLCGTYRFAHAHVVFAEALTLQGLEDSHNLASKCLVELKHINVILGEASLSQDLLRRVGGAGEGEGLGERAEEKGE